MDSELKTHLEGMEARIVSGTAAQIVAAEQRMGDKIVAVEQRMGDKIVAVEQRMGDKIVALEVRTDAKLDALASTLGDVVTLIDKRFDEVEAKLDPLVNQVSGHEKRITVLEDRLPKLATK